MNSDPGSLDNLRELVEPVPVSWWPPAPGWWVLLAVFVVALGGVAVNAWLHWRRNAYRRAALAELRQAKTPAEIDSILKRTALSVWPRSEVAPLSGEPWCDWLTATGGKAPSAAVAELLTYGLYRPGSAPAVEEFRTFAARWIERHHPPMPEPHQTNWRQRLLHPARKG